MNITIIRRRKLGKTSCEAIKRFSKNTINIVRNDQVIPEDSDLVIRWGCTSEIPAEHTLNKARGITIVNNKISSRRLFVDNNISTPKLYNLEDNITYPVIIRPEHHSQGRNLYIANNMEELLNAIRRIGPNYYISEFIDKDKEFGVFIFDNRVSAVIEKVPKYENANKELAWNVAQGTHSFENVRWENWPVNVCIEALKAFKLVDLDFGRVDVMVKDNVPYILEINSAHSLTSEYRQQTFAKCLDYYIEKGKVTKDIDFTKVKTYKSIIHPALYENNIGINL